MRANLQLNERAAPLSIALVGIPDAFMVRKWAPRMTQVTVATTTGAVSWTAPVVTGRSWPKLARCGPCCYKRRRRGAGAVERGGLENN